MKQFRLWMLAAVLLWMMPQVVQANDYLEQADHYTVQSMGNGVLRFTIPIWVYGAINDYYLSSSNDLDDYLYDSYIWYSEKENPSQGTVHVHRIAARQDVLLVCVCRYED